MEIRFGSVCSGIEAASVAWNPIGWKAAWFSEIEPFPCELLKYHYPDVINYGDMTTLADRILCGEIEAPDVFCGGTPCQAFSVAGLRKSLDDARGNLSLVFCEIANAIDSVRAIQRKRPVVVFGKTSPESSAQKITPSAASWLGLLEATFPFHPEQIDGQTQVWLPDPKGKQPGESLTLSLWERPNDAVESSLSQVLQDGDSILPKYYLSAKACLGILRRAARRGKVLPPSLREALELSVRMSPQAL